MDLFVKHPDLKISGGKISKQGYDWWQSVEEAFHEKQQYIAKKNLFWPPGGNGKLQDELPSSDDFRQAMWQYLTLNNLDRKTGKMSGKQEVRAQNIASQTKNIVQAIWNNVKKMGIQEADQAVKRAKAKSPEKKKPETDEEEDYEKEARKGQGKRKGAAEKRKSGDNGQGGGENVHNVDEEEEKKKRNRTTDKERLAKEGITIIEHSVDELTENTPNWATHAVIVKPEYGGLFTIDHYIRSLDLDPALSNEEKSDKEYFIKQIFEEVKNADSKTRTRKAMGKLFLLQPTKFLTKEQENMLSSQGLLENVNKAAKTFVGFLWNEETRELHLWERDVLVQTIVSLSHAGAKVESRQDLRDKVRDKKKNRAAVQEQAAKRERSQMTVQQCSVKYQEMIEEENGKSLPTLMNTFESDTVQFDTNKMLVQVAQPRIGEMNAAPLSWKTAVTKLITFSPEQWPQKEKQNQMRSLVESRYFATFNPNYPSPLTDNEQKVRSIQIAKAVYDFNTRGLVETLKLKQREENKEGSRPSNIDFDQDRWDHPGILQELSVDTAIVEKGMQMKQLHAHWNVKIMHYSNLQIDYPCAAVMITLILNKQAEMDFENGIKMLKGDEWYIPEENNEVEQEEEEEEKEIENMLKRSSEAFWENLQSAIAPDEGTPVEETEISEKPASRGFRVYRMEVLKRKAAELAEKFNDPAWSSQKHPDYKEWRKSLQDKKKADDQRELHKRLAEKSKNKVVANVHRVLFDELIADSTERRAANSVASLN